MKINKFKIASVLFISVTWFSFAQNGAFTSEGATARSSIGARTAASGLAEQEFRRGVQAYYRGAFNDSILEFEKALSYLPSENIILDWL